MENKNEKSMNYSNVEKNTREEGKGENVEVTFFEGKDKKVIGRIPDGRIALIHFDFEGFAGPGETWNCEIIAYYSNKVIVNPFDIIRTAKDNAALVEAENIKKVKELKDKDWNKSIGRSWNPVNNARTVKKGR